MRKFVFTKQSLEFLKSPFNLLKCLIKRAIEVQI